MQTRAIFIYLPLGNLSLARHRVPRAVDTRDTLVKQLLIDFKHYSFIARLRACLRNTTTHQTTAHYANLSYSHRLLLLIYEMTDFPHRAIFNAKDNRIVVQFGEIDKATVFYSMLYSRCGSLRQKLVVISKQPLTCAHQEGGYSNVLPLLSKFELVKIVFVILEDAFAVGFRDD